MQEKRTLRISFRTLPMFNLSGDASETAAHRLSLEPGVAEAAS
jgi:hypothetical protein